MNACGCEPNGAASSQCLSMALITCWKPSFRWLGSRRSDVAKPMSLTAAAAALARRQAVVAVELEPQRQHRRRRRRRHITIYRAPAPTPDSITPTLPRRTLRADSHPSPTAYLREPTTRRQAPPKLKLAHHGEARRFRHECMVMVRPIVPRQGHVD